ncbi:Phospholipid hydroperoxide glutathione peroxidase 1, chloroplastic [Linum perenne]
MACSLPFTATFSSPSHKYIAEKPSFYSLRQQQSFGSSKSGFLRHGFSLQSQNSVGFVRKTPSFRVFARAATEKSIHDFTVKDIDGKNVSLSKFKGKALLIVNVASRCGLTSSNYSELSHVYEKYKTQGQPNSYKSAVLIIVRVSN